jgi:tetratricopeptide (TPR) repeat protein
LAPYYAQPHWQLGNILVRAGQPDEGFKELSLAGESNPSFMPGVIDLAWQSSHGDVQFVVRALKPQRPESYQSLAAYFRKQGQIEAAIAMYKAAGDVAQQDRQAYVGELISAKHFKAAQALWSYGRPASPKDPLASIIDPGFEQESKLDKPGFGWRTENKSPSLSLALDPANPKEGHSSLRVEFAGASDPGLRIISQLVLVEPRSHYQLEFAARTENVVSGGLPSVTVADASDNAVLGQPVLLLQQADNWQSFLIDFTSKESTTAIQISLQRERCSTSPCPIFGRLWLDDFSLRVIR